MRGRVLTLDAPISGDVIPLSEVNDQTFATGLLGQGVAIQPTGTRVIAPADAKVEAIFPTGHAVALNTVDGLDVLIHVGLDTVQLEGEHFTVHAQVGDIVHKGDVLAYVDDEPQTSAIDGIVRGMLHDGLEVTEGFKIADVDPRGESVDWHTPYDKAYAIARAVLELVEAFFAGR